MLSGVIIKKMKKIGVVLILSVLCAAYPVRADQPFVLTVGETMVIPCLYELWSDQSVSFVITEPQVLMADESGRAVVALSEGTSDVYVHITNPETDVHYTFVVEPAQLPEPSPEPDLPEETAVGSGYGGSGGTDTGGVASESGQVNEESRISGGGHISERSLVEDDIDVGHVTEGDGAYDGHESEVIDMTESDGGSTSVEETDTSSVESAGSLSEQQAETNAPVEDVPRPRRMTETVPFWENLGSGGIQFEMIEDDVLGKIKIEGENNDNQKVEYRPFAYLKSDGEVVPLFVCAGGREVRWKYLGRVLYIETSSADTGTYRVGAYDSRGNMHYFSS